MSPYKVTLDKGRGSFTLCSLKTHVNKNTESIYVTNKFSHREAQCIDEGGYSNTVSIVNIYIIPQRVLLQKN